jgi:hypothetical protein
MTTLKLSEKQKELIHRYSAIFSAAGGNDIVELCERKGVNYFNNPVVAEMQGCCWAQVHLLERLVEEGML